MAVIDIDAAECLPQRPANIRLGGPPPSAARDGLLFTNDFPCGTEVSATELLRIPMHTVARIGGCAGDPSCGSRALITAHVQAITTSRTAGDGPLTFTECAANAHTSEPRVKLAVTSCGAPGPVIMDSDSALVVPSGPVQIRVLVPGPDGAGTGAWQVMGQIPAGVEDWTDVVLKIAICPMLGDAFWPKGVLTEWAALSDATVLAQRILVRPRRARSLAAHAVTAAFATSNVLVVSLASDQATPLGATTFQAGFPLTADPFGAAPWVTPISPAGLITATLRWGIE